MAGTTSARAHPGHMDARTLKRATCVRARRLCWRLRDPAGTNPTTIPQAYARRAVPRADRHCNPAPPVARPPDQAGVDQGTGGTEHSRSPATRAHAACMSTANAAQPYGGTQGAWMSLPERRPTAPLRTPVAASAPSGAILCLSRRSQEAALLAVPERPSVVSASRKARIRGVRRYPSRSQRALTVKFLLTAQHSPIAVLAEFRQPRGSLARCRDFSRGEGKTGAARPSFAPVRPLRRPAGLEVHSADCGIGRARRAVIRRSRESVTNL